MTQEMFEKLKFFPGQLHGVAPAKDLVAPEIDLDITERVAIHFLRQGLRAP
jgi:hypothetical protein